MTELSVVEGRPAGSALAIRRDQEAFSREQVEALKKMNGWDQVPAAELSVFFHQAQRTGLDPFARQIYLIGRRNNRANRTDYTIQTSIDGMRLVADRTGRYAGSDRPVFGEDHGDKYAEVTVYKIVGGVRAPFTGVVYEAEFRQEHSPMWRKMPRTMLAKCAEAQALRKAFPADLSGIYGTEEMDQAGPAVGVEEQVQGRAGRDLATQAEPEPALEGEVVEEEGGGLPPQHRAVLEEIAEVAGRIPRDRLPDMRQIREYATAKYGNALQALQRLRALEEEIAVDAGDETGEAVEDEAPVGEPAGGDLPATRKQLDYLEALVADIVGEGEDWREKVRDVAGKPVEDLTREEASSWINRLSGRAS
jgi:phage recombination protein Bet